MSLTQYYTATSLDGFIADPDNSLDWLFSRAREPGGPLSYDEFIAGVGALAMGSTTYEWILDHGGEWPYEVPCWVFTHRELRVVPDAEIEFTSADVATVHREMIAAAGGRNVWIVGGETWRVSSPTRGCWTRSSSRSRRSRWAGVRLC